MEPVKNNIIPIKGEEGTDPTSMVGILQKDVEYKYLADYVPLKQGLLDSLDADVMAETRLDSVSNVVNLLYMDVQGHSLPRICMVLGLNTKDVQKIRSSDAYSTVRAALLAEILTTSKRVMEVSTLKAVKTLYECMDSGSEKIKLMAAKEILDRVGLNATQKLELSTTEISGMTKLTEEQLQEILKSTMPGIVYSVEAEVEVLANEDDE